MPTGQSEHRSECQFRISIPDNIQGVWDPTNDKSYAGLEQGGEDAMVATHHLLCRRHSDLGRRTGRHQAGSGSYNNNDDYGTDHHNDNKSYNDDHFERNYL